MGDGLSSDALRRIRTRMEHIDTLPPLIRALVQEYGWLPVKELMALGVMKPNRIEHIILTCRNGVSPKAAQFRVTHNKAPRDG